ncbi:MAG: hypothetical protein QNJ46_10345 [Leptolyngbyaceae cyanobacterium MO_188.B28]|nr:hypothetical protein [Leptolyngbyaceae cyanobacterium MO_188.B28]
MKRLLLGYGFAILNRLQTHSGRTAVGTIGLMSILGAAGGVWLGQAAISPQAAHAYTSRVSLFLTRELNERYTTLIRRAEITARAGAQRSFDADLLVTEVIITVVGENQGISVPILTLQATREQWRNRPEPQYWSTYYPDARELLGVPEAESLDPDASPPQTPGQIAPIF